MNRLPTLLVFAGLSFGILCLGHGLSRRKNPQATPPQSGLTKREAVVLFLLAASLWVLLFLNNLKWLPPLVGFDVADHLEYIDYLRQRHVLSLADVGWETHQPPLYYLICASILSVFRLPTTSPAGVGALRLLGLILGLVQIGLAFASLRLIFSDDARKQSVGMILVAFMPVTFCLYQYVFKSHPQNAPAHSALAWTLEKAGRTAEAQQEYAAAWQVDPNDPDFAERACRLTNQEQVAPWDALAAAYAEVG